MSKQNKRIFITESDLARLERLMANLVPSDEVTALQEELQAASLVPSEEIPGDVVTMNSIVRFRDAESGEEREIRLVYPSDANLEKGYISVFAPIGTALLGLSEGASVEWPVPSGRKRQLTIVSVVYQPEAAGRFDL